MNEKAPKLVVIVPCYNEEEMLPISQSLFADELQTLIETDRVSPESIVLFVDDGSSDATWRVISDLAKRNPRFRGVRQSRNRGHQYALWAGFEEAVSLGCDATITIDCDGQDDVHVMEAMMDEFSKGTDVVYGVRNDRSTDTFLKRFTAVAFYRFQAAMGVEAVFNHADYRLLSARVVGALLQFREVNLYLRGLIPLVGFKSAQVHYKREKRMAGKGHYGFFKMLAFASDGITSLSIRPIRLVLSCGMVLAAIGVSALAAAGIACLCGAKSPGALIVSAVVTAIGGFNLIGLGVIGEYVGKAYMEAKGRPRAVISERTWHKE